MTAVAIRRQLAIVQVGQVTGIAGSVDMFSVQGELGVRLMIELCCVPIRIFVASFAAQTITAFVLIIVLVTGMTIAFQFDLVRILAVARFAAGLFMAAIEGELGVLIVIEGDLLP